MSKILGLHNLRNSVFKKECANNNLTRVKDLIERDTESNLDLTRGLLKACENGSLSIVKHLLETPNIKEKIDLNASFDKVMDRSLCNEALITSYMNCHSEIVDYLLFKINIDISERTKKSLKLSGSQDLLNKIEKRDLLIELNEEINNPEKKEKTSKLKI